MWNHHCVSRDTGIQESSILDRKYFSYRKIENIYDLKKHIFEKRGETQFFIENNLQKSWKTLIFFHTIFENL